MPTTKPQKHNQPHAALRIHDTTALEKGLAREKVRGASSAATWKEVSGLCFNQTHGNLIQVKDPTGGTKDANAWSRQWIIDPVPVPCVTAKLTPPVTKPVTLPTQLKIADTWADGGVSRLSTNASIYACVGNGTDVPAGHIISGLSSFTASGAAVLQCSINGGELLPRKIGLKRKYRGGN